MLPAEPHGWQLKWDRDALLLHAEITAPDEERYIFEFRFDDYPELPPLVDLVHPDSGERNTARGCFPSGGKSYFHPNNLICAYWSRRAYGALGGPHNDPTWIMGDWARSDPTHREIGLILALLADLFEDPSYQGRTL